MFNLLCRDHLSCVGWLVICSIKCLSRKINLIISKLGSFIGVSWLSSISGALLITSFQRHLFLRIHWYKHLNVKNSWFGRFPNGLTLTSSKLIVDYNLSKSVFTCIKPLLNFATTILIYFTDLTHWFEASSFRHL